MTSQELQSLIDGINRRVDSMADDTGIEVIELDLTSGEIEELYLNWDSSLDNDLESEEMDLECGMSYEDWQEIYGVDNTPGYSERYGQF